MPWVGPCTHFTLQRIGRRTNLGDFKRLKEEKFRHGFFKWLSFDENNTSQNFAIMVNLNAQRVKKRWKIN